jgi:hypothetical protein
MALLAVLPLGVRGAQPRETARAVAARTIIPHERRVGHGRRSPWPRPLAPSSRGQSNEAVPRTVLVLGQRARRVPHHVALRATLVRRMADLRSHPVAQLHALAVAGQTAGNLALVDLMRNGGRSPVIGAVALTLRHGPCTLLGVGHGQGLHRKRRLRQSLDGSLVHASIGSPPLLAQLAVARSMLRPLRVGIRGDRTLRHLRHTKPSEETGGRERHRHGGAHVEPARPNATALSTPGAHPFFSATSSGRRTRAAHFL